MPTAEQLSCLRVKLQGDAVPYVDFSLFGPYGKRQAKMMKHAAQIFVGGELVAKQMPGPPNFAAWRQCFRVYRVAMI
eukprot:6429354-Amphidinium_carterae.1